MQYPDDIDPEILAARLRDADAQVDLRIWPKLTHGCLQMTRDVQSARHAVTSVARSLSGQQAAAF